MLKLMEKKIPKYYAEIVCLSKPREDPNQAITCIYPYELNVLIEFFLCKCYRIFLIYLCTIPDTVFSVEYSYTNGVSSHS